VTVYRWVQRFTPLLIDAARPCWHVAREIGGLWMRRILFEGRRAVVYLYRVIDQYGQGHRRAGLPEAGPGGYPRVLHARPGARPLSDPR
jgi:hypothetical protein